MNNTNTTLVSIIIPNFNKEEFIRETIELLIVQDYKNWEALIIDDGSTDNSLAIINEYVKQDARIKLFQRKRAPKGGSTCRNIGIENAKGEYLLFFDSDDLMTSECISERVLFMNDNQDIDFAVFPVGTFYKKIGDSSMIWRPKKRNHLKQFLSHDLPWHTMSPIWKSSFVKKQLKGFDESFLRLQDVEFHTRALLESEVNYKILRQTSPKCFYRIDDNRTKQSHAVALDTMFEGISCYIHNFGNILISPKNKKQLRGTLISFLTQVNYGYVTTLITASEYQSLLLAVESIIPKSPIFSKSSKAYLQLYSKLYNIGLWRVKGFNWFFKKIWQII